MKTIKLKQLLIPGLILFSQQVFGQLPAIDSLKMIPDNPTIADEIKIICYATFPSGSCNLENHYVTVQGNQITLNLEYNPGAATYICHDVDTVSLGNLEAGDYELDVNLIIMPMDVIEDHDTLYFSIGNLLGINEHPNNFDVSIHPNPFNKEIRIETDAIIETIELNSISGQKVSKEINLNFDKKIDLSDLKDGIYLLTLTDVKGNKSTKRVFKSTL
ncbi:T9SS type A sorting domain-containing protein [Fluviicola sp.]|uniref:T9SS type A sorting domain-containing protein n=1 Tax=Fluviicola sp. TaxID=1917219 RepID=UPI003D26E09B